MYNRLFTKILDSSIWLEADATRIVWITLLAAMDEDGYADFSCNENLARRANVPVKVLEDAIKILESPDKFNPNDEFQGRRIERLPEGGWLILKAPYYRTLLTREIAREKTRLRVEKHRAKANVTNEMLPNVTNVTDGTCNTSEQSIAHAHAHAQQSKAVKEKEKEKEISSFFNAHAHQQRPTTKYGYPLPPRCTIRASDGAVLDYTNRVMDINQVRNALAAAGIATNTSPLP